MSRRPRLALLPGEPIRERMGGIGVRYLELARRLPDEGVDVVLLQPGGEGERTAARLTGVEVRGVAPGSFREAVDGCDAALAQGQPANDLLLEAPDLPVAVDLYDPFLVENLGYLDRLGLAPWRNDHATWVLQMSRADFFVCSCEEQRLYYQGFLTALGRVNPERYASEADLRNLIDVVPFGVSPELPPHEPLLPPRAAGEVRLFFGGLYDWYDPRTLLEGLESDPEPGWAVYFVRSPHPESTPQERFREVERWAAKSRSIEVRFLDWVPADRRWDLLRDVDLLVATHRPSLETRLSLRTRFLEALAADLPVVTTDGGAIARLLLEYGAGCVVPAGDAGAIAPAVREALDRGEERHGHRRGLLENFAWPRVLEPLVRFAQEPRIDPTKESFAFPVPTRAPADRQPARWWRRLRSGRR